jgi:hypothetical protein
MTTTSSITIYSGRPDLLKKLTRYLDPIGIEYQYVPTNAVSYTTDVVKLLKRDTKYNLRTLVYDVACFLHVRELYDFWESVCNVENLNMYCTSQRLDVIGVLAGTCLRDFPNIDMKYIRLQQRGDTVQFVEYTLDEVVFAIENDIEIR